LEIKSVENSYIQSVAKRLPVLCTKIIKFGGCVTKFQSVKKWHVLCSL